MVAPVSEYVHVKKAVEDALSVMAEERRVEVMDPRRAFGRVSAEEIRSPMDLPPSTVSRMDGFAVRSEDTSGATERRPSRLKVVGEAEIGKKLSTEVRQGEACRVSTGSFTPDGTDAVVPVEDVLVRGRRLSIPHPAERGSNLFQAGEDVKRGSAVVRRGVRFRAQDVGLVISLGIRSVVVYARPKVAILATGSELTDSPAGRPGKTRNSHGPVFALIAKSLGCEVVNLGVAKDRRSEILRELKRGLKCADMVLTTGGTSMGALDLVGDAVRHLKPSVVHHGIRMDRGRVTGLAVVDGKPIVMMPGPIQGALNAFILVALPLIQRISGGGDEVVRVRARLIRRWEARRRFPNFTKVVYLRLIPGRRGMAAEPMTAETESMSLIAKSGAVAVVPEEVRSMEPGQEVEAMLLPGVSYSV